VEESPPQAGALAAIRAGEGAAMARNEDARNAERIRKGEGNEESLPGKSMEAALMTAEEARYFDRLIGRHALALCIPPLVFADAQPAQCHSNAARFAALYPGYDVVPGWLIAKLEGFPQYLLNAHSVVRRKADGAVFDVTPIAERDRAVHRFLAHEGTDTAFDELKVRYAQLYYPPLAALIAAP
jgi:hypothetical protein